MHGATSAMGGEHTHLAQRFIRLYFFCERGPKGNAAQQKNNISCLKPHFAATAENGKI